MEYKYYDENDLMEYDKEFEDFCEECGVQYKQNDDKDEYSDEDFGHMSKKFEVDRVRGIGWGKANLEVRIPIVPAGFEILEDLIDRKVVVDKAIAKKGQVFLNGFILKNIPFKTSKRSFKCPTNEISELHFGDIKHVTVKIPFNMCIDVKGAFSGADVKVLEKKVESVEIAHCVKCKHCKKRHIRWITEKDCVFVKVKVTKDEIVEIPKKDECDWFE